MLSFYNITTVYYSEPESFLHSIDKLQFTLFAESVWRVAGYIYINVNGTCY